MTSNQLIGPGHVAQIVSTTLAIYIAHLSWNQYTPARYRYAQFSALRVASGRTSTPAQPVFQVEALGDQHDTLPKMR
jgi:hypothetical protein